MGYWLKLLPFFLIATMKFGFAVPVAIRTMEFTVLEAFVFSMLSGSTGTFVFYFFGKTFNDWFEARKLKKRQKLGIVQPKVKFSRRKRMIVKIKSKYGLPGIAFFTPSFFSIPVGIVIAVRFYPHSKKILPWMLASVFVWALSFSLAFGYW